jgi:hypothetical protein
MHVRVRFGLVIRHGNTLPNSRADASKIPLQSRKFSALLQFCKWLYSIPLVGLRRSLASIARRRHLAASGPMPPVLAARFTQAEMSALRIISDEVRHHGVCGLHIDAIAARAGTCRTTVKNDLREARRLNLVTVQERRRRGGGDRIGRQQRLRSAAHPGLPRPSRSKAYRPLHPHRESAFRGALALTDRDLAAGDTTVGSRPTPKER